MSRTGRVGCLALGVSVLVLSVGCASGGRKPQPTASSGAAAPVGSASATPASPPGAPATQPPPAPTAAPPTPGVPATALCQTRDLRVATGGPLGAAAGNRYVILVFTNAGGRPCHTYGYIGMQLLAAGGGALATRVVRESAPAPRRVVLAPGATAWTRLHWGAIPSNGDSLTGPCQPSPARVLVTPPDNTTQLSLPWTYGPVCAQGQIFVTPMQAGSGPG